MHSNQATFVDCVVFVKNDETEATVLARVFVCNNGRAFNCSVLAEVVTQVVLVSVLPYSTDEHLLYLHPTVWTTFITRRCTLWFNLLAVNNVWPVI
jgi:hypothetical protein